MADFFEVRRARGIDIATYRVALLDFAQHTFKTFGPSQIAELVDAKIASEIRREEGEQQQMGHSPEGAEQAMPQQRLSYEPEGLRQGLWDKEDTARALLSKFKYEDQQPFLLFPLDQPRGQSEMIKGLARELGLRSSFRKGQLLVSR